MPWDPVTLLRSGRHPCDMQRLVPGWKKVASSNLVGASSLWARCWFRELVLDREPEAQAVLVAIQPTLHNEPKSADGALVN